MVGYSYDGINSNMQYTIFLHEKKYKLKSFNLLYYVCIPTFLRCFIFSDLKMQKHANNLLHVFIKRRKKKMFYEIRRKNLDLKIKVLPEIIKNHIWSHGNETSWNQLCLNISRRFYDSISKPQTIYKFPCTSTLMQNDCRTSCGLPHNKCSRK